MTKQKSKDAPSWVGGYKNRQRAKPQYGKRRVLRVEYSLSELAKEGHLSQETLDEFQRATGLGDMAWRLLWVADGPEPDDEQLQARVAEARGVVMFIHGWDGSGEIWEDLPGLVLSDDPALVALVPDVNGFGGTPFVKEAPAYEQCSPPAAMHAIERWINLLDLRSPRDFPNPRVFTFVGHSMGGAALFFLEDDNWSGLEVARVGAAPALLLRDNLRQGFYRALGAGIMLSRWSTFMDWLQERYLAPRMIEALVGWASDFVKEEHRRIYERTPEAVISRTFTAMGRLEATFDKDRWRHFLVFLAHRDRLVGLMESLELLEELKFEPHQLRVCLGDHYFFSVGKAQPRLHALNREMLKDEILALHSKLVSRQEGET